MKKAYTLGGEGAWIVFEDGLKLATCSSHATAKRVQKALSYQADHVRQSYAAERDAARQEVLELRARLDTRTEELETAHRMLGGARKERDQARLSRDHWREEYERVSGERDRYFVATDGFDAMMADCCKALGRNVTASEIPNILARATIEARTIPITISVKVADICLDNVTIKLPVSE